MLKFNEVLLNAGSVDKVTDHLSNCSLNADKGAFDDDSMLKNSEAEEPQYSATEYIAVNEQEEATSVTQSKTQSHLDNVIDLLSPSELNVSLYGHINGSNLKESDLDVHNSDWSSSPAIKTNRVENGAISQPNVSPLSKNEALSHLLAFTESFSNRLVELLSNQTFRAQIQLLTRIRQVTQLLEQQKAKYVEAKDRASVMYLISVAQALGMQMYANIRDVAILPESLQQLLALSRDHHCSDDYGESSPTDTFLSGMGLLDHLCSAIIAAQDVLDTSYAFTTDQHISEEQLQQENGLPSTSPSVFSASVSMTASTYSRNPLISPGKKAKGRRPATRLELLESQQKRLSSAIQLMSALLYAPLSPPLHKQLKIVLAVGMTLPMISSVLFSEGIPSVATLLVQVRSTLLLHSVYSTWPDLTVKVPVSNASLIARAVPVSLRTPINLVQAKVGKGVSILTSLRQRDKDDDPRKNVNYTTAFTWSAGRTPVNGTGGDKDKKNKVSTTIVSRVPCGDSSTSRTPSHRKASPISATKAKLSRSNTDRANGSASVAFDLSVSNGLDDAASMFSAVSSRHSTSSSRSPSKQLSPDSAERPSLKSINKSPAAAQQRGDEDQDEDENDSCNDNSREVVLSRSAAAVGLDNVDFDSSSSLRHVGFTAQQLFDAQCFPVSSLLSAGYPLLSIQRVAGLRFTMADLRAAGYTVSQCAAAGYRLSDLYNRGLAFNALELTDSDLFSVQQLQAVGCDPQRFALMSLFESTGGEQWKCRTNWGTVWPLGEWFGVSVDRRGQVVALKLPRNYLKGPLPAALSLLPSLRSIDMQGNKISSPLPDSLRRLVELKELLLCNNLLTDRRAVVQSMFPTCHIRL